MQGVASSNFLCHEYKGGDKYAPHRLISAFSTHEAPSNRRRMAAAKNGLATLTWQVAGIPPKNL